LDEARVVIIILTLSQREMTLRCLAHLRALGEPTCSILLWDNGSQDSTVAAVGSEFPEVLVRYSADNLGVAGGRNAAAELALALSQPTHLLFLDNDVMVEPGFVAALLAPFAHDPALGQTQAKLRFLTDRTRLNDGGGARINFPLGRITPVGYGEVDQGQHDRSRPCIACGGAMLVRADVFQQLGGFDTVFNPLGPEDLDFSLRLQKAGYRALYVPDAVGYHKVSHTYGADYNEQYARLKVRHWFRFMRRHASVPQRVGFFLVGAPYMTARALVREAKRGNIGAWRGFLHGLFDIAFS
jgi:GT2 family glycosyltransferase